MKISTNFLEETYKDKRQELDEIQRVKDNNQRELDRLKGELWHIRSDIPEIELEIEKLHSEYKKLEREYEAKEKQLNELDDKSEKELEDLKVEFQKYKENTESDFNSKIDKLSSSYDEKTHEAIRRKEKAFSEKKNQLMKELTDLTNIHNNLDKDFEASCKSVDDSNSLEFDNVMLQSNKKREALKNSLLSETRAIDETKKELEMAGNDLKAKIQLHSKLTTEFENSKQNTSAHERATFDIRCEISDLETSLKCKEEQLNFLILESESYKTSTLQLKKDISSEEVSRRRLHNELQDLKGNIRVFCRVKPESLSNSFKFETSSISQSDDGKEHIIITEPKNETQTQLTFANKVNIKRYNFGFDKVFGMASTNNEIFEEIGQLVQSALDGYNVSIFTYGQTGSGKTYTMSNTKDGLIPSSVNLIFSKTKNLEESDWKFDISGQFLEIYNENINDLTTPNYLKNLDKNKYEIKHDEVTQTTTVQGLTTVKLESPEKVDEILKMANMNRATASTNSNSRSSRSHLLFMISISGHNYKTGEEVKGRLNLIDLAGSERIAQSLVTGDRLKETQMINKSLSSLGDVITSLCNNQQHIPYRNSKLTYLLQYSLGGTAKTLMFVNVSGNIKHFNETLNSLRFATKVNNTQLGK
ncbi:hypothetical protein CANARDRAFT_203234 [[Candida] arabinofermentans NRRL YB-2248]|uniref:Kinesin-like protein n=1 Tax=[Candida] arabinofermentans NRRL YB-2248 TaxID=983967 RepID=A0A1E4SV36_9ASCO|nr:hypothetical protein CANARDRAFT_203234 [[Candida] arabinofermentans NRRL YB-2248]